MAKYQITLMVEEKLPASVEKKLRQVFGDVPVHTTEKVTTPESRAARLAEASGMLDNAISVVRELKEEMENWRDTIPENLQGGDKYSQIEESIDGLENLEGELDSAIGNFEVEFPSMIG